MKQEVKSQRSRELIKKAGLRLFSSNGFRGTTLKQIANEAGISVGRVYHHFPNKLELFKVLLNDYWLSIRDQDLPIAWVIEHSQFPFDIPDIVRATREMVYEFREYIMLIYIDVIEFQGEHIGQFYNGMAERFALAYKKHLETKDFEGVFNDDVDPLFAIMLIFRFCFQYFVVESSFGVKEHFGISDEEMSENLTKLLLNGLLSQKTEVVVAEPPLKVEEGTVKPE